MQDLVDKMDSEQSLSSLGSGRVQPDGLGPPVPAPVHAPGFGFNRNSPLNATSVSVPVASSVTAPQASQSTDPSQQCDLPPSVQNALHDTYTLTLADGYVLKYSEADFQDIPSTSGVFSDASRLAAVWDDALPLWGKKEYSPLIVRNIPIAIKYWKQFYRQFQKVEHQNCWTNWRQNWYNYQVRGEMFEFSPDGSDAIPTGFDE